LAAAKSHPQRVLQADSTDHVDSGQESSTPGGHQLYTYKSVDRNIPSLFLTRILSMSFHVPEDNRIAKQVSISVVLLNISLLSCLINNSSVE